MSERLGFVPELLRGRALRKSGEIYRRAARKRYRIVSEILANYDARQEEKED